MNGSAIPANNLTFGGAVAILWYVLIRIAQANNWLDIPNDIIAPSCIAVNFLASHAWDWRTGDNKPPSPPKS